MLDTYSCTTEINEISIRDIFKKGNRDSLFMLSLSSSFLKDKISQN